jgi:hypothetical protein
LDVIPGLDGNNLGIRFYHCHIFNFTFKFGRIAFLPDLQGNNNISVHYDAKIRIAGKTGKITGNEGKVTDIKKQKTQLDRNITKRISKKIKTKITTPNISTTTVIISKTSNHQRIFFNEFTSYQTYRTKFKLSHIRQSPTLEQDIKI